FGSPVFKTGAFNRSATLPMRRTINIPNGPVKHQNVRLPEKQPKCCYSPEKTTKWLFLRRFIPQISA
ncbi:hypothetical protein, partial [Kluyvera ascorbata]|uniref:hypothetical protein n=1 Tax=Kluyvera ascorbata TaxID=51288 RepID=UPI002904AD4B